MAGLPSEQVFFQPASQRFKKFRLTPVAARLNDSSGWRFPEIQRLRRFA
jgi:hypothetical protein